MRSAAGINALTLQSGDDATPIPSHRAPPNRPQPSSPTRRSSDLVNPITENPNFGGAVATNANEEGGLVTLGATVATHDADDGAISVTITGLANDQIGRAHV